MATRDTDYTKTGNGWLASLANKMSFIPGIGFLTGPMLMIDAGITAIGWAFRGKFASAGAALGSGLAAGGIASLNSGPMMPIYWATNVLSGITTGRSVQTHGRALTESATSFVTKPLGMQPTVLKSYYAGVGGVAGASMGAPKQPGRFANQIAAERGKDSQEMYDNYMRGEGGVAVAQAGGQASRA
jgi:hypothetical protein